MVELDWLAGGRLFPIISLIDSIDPQQYYLDSKLNGDGVRHNRRFP